MENANQKNEKIFNEIENFNALYLNLIKLFTQIKFSYILKRFKQYDKKYLLEYQKTNFNKNLDKDSEKQENNIDNNKNLLGIPNESEEEIKVLHSSTLIDKIEI